MVVDREPTAFWKKWIFEHVIFDPAAPCHRSLSLWLIVAWVDPWHMVRQYVSDHQLYVICSAIWLRNPSPNCRVPSLLCPQPVRCFYFDVPGTPTTDVSSDCNDLYSEQKLSGFLHISLTFYAAKPVLNERSSYRVSEKKRHKDQAACRPIYINQPKFLQDFRPYGVGGR